MESVVIVKIGGNIVDDQEKLDQFLEDFAAIPSKKILVHGGGKIASKIGETLGIQPKMVDGRRVTDEETLRLVTMVYGGLINKNIVAQLQSLNVNAIGLTGADGNVIRSHKRVVKEVDFGYVGDVDEVNGGLVAKMLEDMTPVFAPLTHDKQGIMLNTNADTIASVLAVSLSEYAKVRLMYCFELPGVMEDINKPDSLITSINTPKYKQLKADGIIADGMIPKMDNCFDALHNGVSEVLICNAMQVSEALNRSDVGTSLIK